MVPSRAWPFPWSNQKLYSPGSTESAFALSTTVPPSGARERTRVSCTRFLGGITTVRATRVVTAPANSAPAVATLPRATATPRSACDLRATDRPPFVGVHGTKSAPSPRTGPHPDPPGRNPAHHPDPAGRNPAHHPDPPGRNPAHRQWRGLVFIAWPHPE